MNIISAWGNSRTELAEEVVMFCVKELMPRMRTLDICVDICEDTDVYGYCLAVNKREFVIEVREDLSDVDFLTTIMHEMTHVAQYAQGRLPINGKIEYRTQEEYENLWYEIEAYQMESVLLKKYLESVK
jgi:hypothetical protein